MLLPENLGPGDLVALALPAGEAWLPRVQRVWSAGAAALPIDPRWPARQTRAVVERACPSVVVEARDARRLLPAADADRGLGLVVATSGTGGAPKLVELSREGIEAAVHGSAARLGLDPADPWLACLPPAHVGGMLVLLRGVVLGSPVIEHPGFDPDSVAAERRVRFASVVPTMLGRLLEAGADLSHLRCLLVGGAGVDDDTRSRASEAGTRLVVTYGLTESSGGVVYDGLPFEGTSIRIDGPTNVVELRGPTIMRRYRDDPAATSAAVGADGWLRTADAGELDQSGRLRVLGRLDDAIRTGGETVWPDEVERALRSHSGVAEIAVAATDDPEWGQRVVAFVVPSDPEEPPTLEVLRDHAAARIARFKAPRELVIVDHLPRTPSEKTDRIALVRDRLR